MATKYKSRYCYSQTKHIIEGMWKHNFPFFLRDILTFVVSRNLKNLSNEEILSCNENVAAVCGLESHPEFYCSALSLLQQPWLSCVKPTVCRELHIISDVLQNISGRKYEADM
jgi:hypothetical protein